MNYELKKRIILITGGQRSGKSRHDLTGRVVVIDCGPSG